MYELDIYVCSTSHLVFGRVPMRRLDSEKWRLLPERVIRKWPGGVEELETLQQPIAYPLGFGDSIVLTNTPPDVDALLAAL